MNTTPNKPAASQQQNTPSVAAVALDPVRLLRTYWPWLAGAAVAGLVLGVAAFILLNTFFKRFASDVVFGAQPAQSDNVTEEFGLGIAGEEGEIFMATQVFALESEDTLRTALREPAVQNTSWVQQFTENGAFDEVEALNELTNIANASVVPQTSYFRIRVSTPSAEDAAAIAGAIGDVYLRNYRREANRQANELIANVERQINALRGEINDLDLRISGLLQEAGIQSLDNADLSEQFELQRLQPLIVENRDERSRLQDTLDEFLRIQNQAGPPVYPDSIREAAIQSPVAQQLESNIAAQRARYRALTQTFSDDHPEVQRARELLRSYENERETVIEQKMAEQFSGAIEAYRNQISALDASHADMVRKREELNAALVDKTNVIKEATEASRERQLKAERLQQRLDDRASLEIIANRGGRVSVISSATIPDEPAFPKIVATVAVTFVVLTGLVAGVIVLKELREQRVRSPRDISLIPATRVLGVFPTKDLDPSKPLHAETATQEQPLGAIAESARELRNSILKACDARGHRTIVFTSGFPRSGCSAVVTNLAHAAANVEMRILVIDANLRRPSLHTNLNASNERGIADALTANTEPEQLTQQITPNLHFIPAGANPGHAYERFGTARMTEILDWAKANYDLVLIDSPPTIIASDALALASCCDASVLVVRAYSEKRGLVARIRNMLGDARADFLGVVVNAVQLTAGGYFKQNIRASVEYHADSRQSLDADASPSRANARPQQAAATE